jgi:hypothetical protein
VRFVDRTKVAAPASLSAPSAAVKAEADAAKLFYGTYDYMQPQAKGFEFKEYKAPDVVVKLRELFYNKCAYCESDLGDAIEIEHFRPKGGVHQLPHPGYWWLAHEWTNLLPSCVPCNQRRRQHLVTETTTEAEFRQMQAARAKVPHGKANQFPIAGTRAMTPTCDLAAEQALLLDPCVDDPENFLRWSGAGDYSVVLAVSTTNDAQQRALTTIGVFALNRLNLVQSRTRVLNELRYQRASILRDLEEDVLQGGSPRLLARAVRRVEEMRRQAAAEQPFTAMVKEFVDAFAEELQDRLASYGLPPQPTEPEVGSASSHA